MGIYDNDKNYQWTHGSRYVWMEQMIYKMMIRMIHLFIYYVHKDIAK